MMDEKEALARIEKADDEKMRYGVARWGEKINRTLKDMMRPVYLLAPKPRINRRRLHNTYYRQHIDVPYGNVSTARSTQTDRLNHLPPPHTEGQNFRLTPAERYGKIKIMSALVVAGLCVTWWETCWQIKATRQTVRQRVLVPRCGGSSPSWPVVIS